MTDQDKHYALETLAVHAGQASDPITGARAAPIYQTSSFVFEDTEHARQLFALEKPGYIYTRIGNPTTDVFEQRVAAMEGGVAALATASGMAAIATTIYNLTQAGDEVVTSSNLYGGTYNLFANTLPKHGITFRFVDPADLGAMEAAINEHTKLIYAETIGNPRLDVLDIEAYAKLAHKHGLPLVVDNTFPTPYLCRPISYGADIVIHSATKWIGGHGTAIGGIAVDGGTFDWTNGKFPGFTEPDASYHGIRYGIDTAPAAFATKLRVQYLRDVGAALSPFNAFLFLQGLETLPVRMERHCENAMKVAEFLKGHPGVGWVAYPGLPDYFSHDLASRYLSGGYGAIVNFGIKGGAEAGAKFIDAVELWSHLANVGDAKSLVIHPATTTHQQLSTDQRRSAGVPDDLVRCSVGIEAASDLIADLDAALKKAAG